MNYFPITESDEKEMLREIGVKDFDQIISHIPKKLLHPEIHLPRPLGEFELKKEIEALASSNQRARGMMSFLGGGIYEHFIPSAINHLASRGEFLTAYTPYQAEASQGTLQAIYEFQTLISKLTGMEVSNASHYDGATALAEAVILSINHTGRKKVLVSSLLHPDYRDVIGTYLKGGAGEMVSIPHTKEGVLERQFITKNLNDTIAGVVISYPNYLGIVENFADISKLARERGALTIVSANPMALSFYESPGALGADVVTGEGQPLGIPMSYGGPLLGFFTTTKELMRKIPGRIVGMTRDTEGRPAFVLTLQAREQHIRREKATSNICSNQALMALRATIYLALLGEEGLKRVGEMNVANALYLKDAISKIKKFETPFKGPVFNEFVVRFQGDVLKLLERLQAKNIYGGIQLEKFHTALKGAFLVTVTETKTRDDLDRFVEVLRGVSVSC